MEKNPIITKQKTQVFTKPFSDLIDTNKWNNEMGPFYKRINTLKDDRSFVILTTTIIEFHIDRLLSIIFPGFNEKLKNNIDFTFSIKLKILDSMKLLPHQIFIFAECVRKIRNEFAHNISIDKIIDIKTLGKKEAKLILALENLCSAYNDCLAYSKFDPTNYRNKFKDIANFVIRAFREYEPNFISLRKELDSDDFEYRLSAKNKNKV